MTDQPTLILDDMTHNLVIPPYADPSAETMLWLALANYNPDVEGVQIPDGLQQFTSAKGTHNPKVIVVLQKAVQSGNPVTIAIAGVHSSRITASLVRDGHTALQILERDFDGTCYLLTLIQSLDADVTLELVVAASHGYDDFYCKLPIQIT